jgi:hypothetical protein
MTTQKSITSQQLIDKKIELGNDGSRIVYYNKGRKHLLITVGDSWTYGDSLGGSHPYKPSSEWDALHEKNYHDRMQHCFGRHVADALLADWFECSTRGCDNNHILKEAKWWCQPDAAPILEQYHRVYICVVLTEVGRAAGAYWNGSYRPQSLLAKEEINTYRKLAELQKNKSASTHFWFGRNMTLSLKSNHITRSPWIDVIAGKPIAQRGWLTGVASHKISKLYEGTKQHDVWKQHFVEHTERVAPVWDHLREHKHHYSGHTCHPTPEGHKMYADYILANADW